MARFSARSILFCLLSAYCGYHYGLYGVHAVLRLVKHLGCGGTEHLVAHFHFRKAELFVYIAAHQGKKKMVTGQAMKECEDLL